MQVQRLDHLLKNNDNETLVNLPSGKISKKEQRTPIKPQKNVSCILYAMRRIGFFNDPDVKYSNLYKAFRKIKKQLIIPKVNINQVLTVVKDVCNELGINIDLTISSNKSYSEINKKNKLVQLSLLYEALLKTRFFFLFNVQESGWRPEDGFNGLKESLKTHGAHVFMGKFGARYHGGKDSLINYDQENCYNREVYAFKKDTYIGDNVSFTHAIVVDQVKIVSGKEMVFFRDPYDTSNPKEDKKEPIYMLSYENFINRLTNIQSMRYALNECSDTERFGMVSTMPKKLCEI